MADVLYATQADLEGALSPTTVQMLFDDDGNGAINQKALIAVLERASREVDSYLARVYVGPFPVVQPKVPAAIRNATLEFAIAFSFERHPEYVHTYGEHYRSKSRHDRAIAMMERICTGLQEIPDWVLQPKARNIGGIIIDDGARTIIDSADGTYNGGDF